MHDVKLTFATAAGSEQGVHVLDCVPVKENVFSAHGTHTALDVAVQAWRRDPGPHVGVEHAVHVPLNENVFFAHGAQPVSVVFVHGRGPLPAPQAG